MVLQISNYNNLCISLAEIKWSIYSISTGRDLFLKRPHLGSTMSISSCYDSGVRVTSESILLEKWMNMW